MSMVKQVNETSFLNSALPVTDQLSKNNFKRESVRTRKRGTILTCTNVRRPEEGEKKIRERSVTHNARKLWRMHWIWVKGKRGKSVL